MQLSKGKLKKIAKKYGLNLVVLFGSSVTSPKLKPPGDIGLAVRKTTVLASEEEISLIEELSLIFPQEIDVTFINEADSVLIYEIARDGEPLYEAEPYGFLNFQIYATKVSEDDRRYRELTKKYVLQREQ